MCRCPEKQLLRDRKTFSGDRNIAFHSDKIISITAWGVERESLHYKTSRSITFSTYKNNSAALGSDTAAKKTLTDGAFSSNLAATKRHTSTTTCPNNSLSGLTE
jgi:hypothetical protein